METKQKSKNELFDADPDTLTNEELIRRATFIELESKESNLEFTRNQNSKFRMQQAQIKDQFTSRGRELNKTSRDQEMQQEHCSHRKGGRGVEALINGGNDSDYAVIRHLLPWNEWYQRCQRCGKTWKPPHEEQFDMKTSAGRDAFLAAKQEYKEALAWPTDNIPSTGITFQHHSPDDGDKSARKFVNDTTKDITLR
jgi:hypothetical protein